MIDVPFPVEAPYAMRPNLRPWIETDSVLIVDEQFDYYIAEKQKFYDPVYGDNASQELIGAAIQALSRLDPTAPNPCGLDGRVWELSMNMQEDWVIWAPNREGELSPQVLSVCLPSGWNPREKVNLSFLKMHEPVPDFDLVNRAADNIARMITEKGPFIRHVWTVTNSSELNRLPGRCREWQNESLDDMWFRCERQMTIPIDGYAALFLIRVYMQPLARIMAIPQRRELIVESINSMSDAVLAYKNLSYVKDFFSRV